MKSTNGFETYLQADITFLGLVSLWFLSSWVLLDWDQRIAQLRSTYKFDGLDNKGSPQLETATPTSTEKN
ncbi:unnamed protein product [Prunus armeniaca]|nr:unnamed protein product [Prunus armeniaca]